MADIKLKLIDLGVELDIPQDSEFPLSLNFTAASMNDIESRSTNFTLEFRIPATKQNKTALGHINSSNVEDGNNVLGKNDCVVLADGLPVFDGKFKVLGVVTDRGSSEFNCIILGNAADWIEGMRNKTLQDYTFKTDGSFTYNQSNVLNSWTNDYTDGYTFPLINYGAWKYADRIVAEDFRPAIFMRSFFEKAFEAEGYTIQTDTDDDDFFHSVNNPDIDSIIIPFTGGEFKRDESVVNEDKFEASTTTERQYEASFIKGDSVTAHPKTHQLSGGYTISSPFNGAGVSISGKSVRRIYLQTDVSSDLNSRTYLVIDNDTTYADINGKVLDTPTSKVNQIVGYGNISVVDVNGSGLSTATTNEFYLDIITHESDDDLGETWINTVSGVESGGIFGSSSNIQTPADFKINLVEVKGGDEDGDVIEYDTQTSGSNASFSLSTNKYTATNYISARFNISTTFTAILKANHSAIRGFNSGVFTFKILHKSGSITTEIGEEFLNATSESNIEQYQDPVRVNGQKELVTPAIYRIGFDSSVVELAPNDEVWVEVEIEHENISEARSNISYRTICNVIESDFKIIPQTDIIEGSSFNIREVLDDRYKTIDYIKGVIHAFNLMIQTDKYTKTVVIKSRDSFYDKTTALDWTDKIDPNKQYEINYLDNYNRYLDFGFQSDSSDGYVTELNKLIAESRAALGAYTEDIGQRFNDERQNMSNPLFSYTYHIADRTVGGSESLKYGVYMARMWKEYAPNSLAPPKAFNFRPRLLFYTNEEQVNNTYFKYYDTNISTIPTALSGNMNAFTPNMDVDLHLGYDDSYSDSGLVSSYYETSVNIIEKGVKVKLPVIFTKKDIQTFDITRRVYLSYPEELRGYWIVDSISNYNPDSFSSANVELIKDENYASREVALGTVAPSEDPQGDWHVEGVDSVDIGNINEGIGKWTAAHVQDAINKSMKSKEEGGTASSHVAAHIKDLIAAMGATQSSSNSSDAKFSKGQQDFHAEVEAKAQYKKEAYKNSKNAVGVSDIEALAKKNYETSFKQDNINPSMVQRNQGNRAIGAGSTILGKGNIGVGEFQTAVGKYNKPSMKDAFSVGTGKSELDRNTAFSVGLDGVVREGGGVIVEEIDDEIRTIYEVIDGELVKITL